MGKLLLVNGVGYVVSQMGCSVCGAACEPLHERCRRCGNDPFAGIGVRLGPLSGRQFLRNFGWRLLIALPFLGWFLWREAERIPHWQSLPNWAQLGLGALIASAILTIAYHLWLTWQAAHGALVLTPAEAWLYQRRGGRVYFERMSWQECLPPESPRGWRVLEALSTLLHIVLHAGLQALAFLVPDQVYELRLRSRIDSERRWRLALVGAQYHPRYSLTLLAWYALPHWLQNGTVHIEPGYEPSPERSFLALDMSTRTLRAYPFKEVRLEEAVVRVTMTFESHNPDGSRVENDHTLDNDAAQAEKGEQDYLEEHHLPAYAVRYGDYWLRADWGIIKRIESRRTASETANLQVQSPKPA
ncbi:MAG: hypothetical protein N2651_02750 [Fimbriimonadales bacterium]|nr:hypothetical protein [Fimbriimonadales bacterium]